MNRTREQWVDFLLHELATEEVDLTYCRRHLEEHGLESDEVDLIMHFVIVEHDKRALNPLHRKPWHHKFYVGLTFGFIMLLVSIYFIITEGYVLYVTLAGSLGGFVMALMNSKRPRR